MIIKSLEEKGRRRETRYLDRLYEWVPMAERIGLKGTSALCILGRPYSIPGLEPVGQSFL